MTDPWWLLGAVTAVLCGASGGAFLVYSTFTTTAFARLRAPQGMAAMQQVNVAAPRSVSFMAVVFAPGALCLVLAVHALLAGSAHVALVVVGAVVYVLGVVGTTAAFHVPRNDRLAALDADVDHAQWPAWLRAWVLGNHVRTLSGLLSAVLIVLSLRS